RELFLKALPHTSSLRSVRAVAYSLLGLVQYYHRHPTDNEVRTIIASLAHYLTDEYRQHAQGEWRWFERIITYDQAVIPLSLLQCGALLAHETMLEIAFESAYFLDSLLFESD